ncbi:MAG: DUF362 domain-containing protein [Candidatus Thermoplasmatota archaeon]|nr:DUF362 domain-containing protein [Candidatus Thermoplasmatota archaeon]
MNTIIYFTNIQQLPQAISYFNIADFSQKQVPIKIHMGEHGNKYFPHPHDVHEAIKLLKHMNAQPYLYDTTVAYNAKRHTIEGYQKLANDHGFGEQDIGCPTIIDDSGKDVIIENRPYTVAQHLHQATHIFAWSHVKGHVATGMGGAIKNFGMGGVTKETKLRIHHSSRPVFNPDACTHCGICAEVCPFNALKITHNTWEKKKGACFGCGVCVNNCTQQALTFEDADLNYLLACAALACVKDKNVIYLNDINRIARSCDCDPNAGPTIAPDIGYLLGTDPVAIDHASLKLIHDIKPKIFDHENHIDPYKQIRYGEKIGLGSTVYQLIDV